MRGGERGSTLVELLVAVALLGLILGVLALLTGPVLAGADADPAAVDAQQRGRSLALALRQDVARAGSGIVLGAASGPGVALPAALPDLWPAGAGAVQARPQTLTTWQARRSAAHARLRAAVNAGELVLPLTRPGWCPATSPTCGFGRDDDLLIAGPHGRFVVATVRDVLPPLDLLLATPILDDLPASAAVTAVETHTYEVRPDAATGLSQVVRRIGLGPATPVIDFVRRFEVEWIAGSGTPSVALAPDGAERRASAGPSPPRAGETGEAPYPPGENCGFFRDAAGAPQWRGTPGGAAAAALPLTALSDGPWCPSPAAATRWDVDLTRVVAVRTVAVVAAATTTLRPVIGLGLARGPGGRVVPDLTIDLTTRMGRHGAGGGD